MAFMISYRICGKWSVAFGPSGWQEAEDALCPCICPHRPAQCEAEQLILPFLPVARSGTDLLLVVLRAGIGIRAVSAVREHLALSSGSGTHATLASGLRGGCWCFRAGWMLPNGL